MKSCQMVVDGWPPQAGWLLGGWGGVGGCRAPGGPYMYVYMYQKCTCICMCHLYMYIHICICMCCKILDYIHICTIMYIYLSIYPSIHPSIYLSILYMYIHIMSTYIPEPQGLLAHCLRPTCREDSHNVALTAALDHLWKPGTRWLQTGVT